MVGAKNEIGVLTLSKKSILSSGKKASDREGRDLFGGQLRFVVRYQILSELLKNDEKA